MAEQPSPASIFERVLQCTDGDQRTLCLKEACGGNDALRREVESLLAAHQAAGSFLEPVVTPEPGTPGEQEGDQIGHYKLLELIGEGGFGRVWMAEQTEPVRRKVALKIVKLGMDTGEVLARFEAERQALALMDHPNIARVFDGGATDTGRPYFVMELVRGLPITGFCDARRMPPRERLDLFRKVCLAVQHAHQKGIIHRDLKPSNILVTVQDDQPVPKVIDFGVAKALQSHLTEKTLFTRFNQWLGTPAYMSPEQAGLGGLDVDTRSDVYSLGTILYELLTGHTPFDQARLRENGYEAMLRTIREEDPPRPSTRLSSMPREELASVAGQRSESPEKLGRAIRGELDWILLKALERDRSRRYESANALARDLECHLHDEAVAASPPTLGYRLGKAARRHRVALATGTVIALSLLVGAGVAAWQAIAATRARDAEVEQRAHAENLLGQNRRQLTMASWTSYHMADRLLLEDGVFGAGPQSETTLGVNYQTSGTREAVLRLARAITLHPMNVAARERFAWAALVERGRLCSLPVERAVFEDMRFAGLSKDGSKFVGVDHSGNVHLQDSLGKGPTATSPMEDISGFEDLQVSHSGRFLAGTRNLGEVVGGVYPESIVGVWDTGTGKLLASLHHDSQVWGSEFSPDESRLITRSEDNSARIWNVSDGRLRFKLPHEAQLNIATFSPDSEYIFTADRSGAGGVFSAGLGDQVFRIGSAEDQEGGSIAEAAFSADNTRLVTVDEVGTRVWDTRDGRLVFRLPEKPVRIRLAPNGQTALALLRSNAISLLNITDGPKSPSNFTTEIQFDDPNPSWFLEMEVDSKAGWFVLAPAPEDVMLVPWLTARTDRGERIPPTPSASFHLAGGLEQLSFTPDGNHVVAICSLTARQGEGPGRTERTVWRVRRSEAGILVAPVKEGFQMRGMAIDRSGSLLLTCQDEMGGKSAVVEIRAIPTGKLLRSVPVEGFISRAGFSHDGKSWFAIAPGQEGFAGLWDSETGSLLHKLTLPTPTDWTATEFDRDGRRLAVRDENGCPRVFDFATDAQIGSDQRPADRQARWRFVGDGSRLIGTDRDHRLLAWDLASGEITTLDTGQHGMGTPIASPDGERIALRTGIGEAWILDSRTGERLVELPGKPGEPEAWSSDGKMLLLHQSNDSDVATLWDCSQRRVTMTIDLSFEQYRAMIWPVMKPGMGGCSLSFDPAGRFLVYSDFFHSVLFGIASGHPLAHSIRSDSEGFGPDGSLVVFDGRMFSTLPARQLEVTGDCSVPAGDFELMARFLAAAELTDKGEIRRLDHEEWMIAANELRARAAVPGPLQQWAQWLTATGDDAPAWPGGPPKPRE